MTKPLIHVTKTLDACPHAMFRKRGGGVVLVHGRRKESAGTTWEYVFTDGISRDVRGRWRKGQKTQHDLVEVVPQPKGRT